jgi:signal transduction histidine kinase
MAIPLMAIQYLQQKESLAIVTEINKKESAEALLSRQMQRLQQLAVFDSKNEEAYKTDFFDLLNYKKQLIAINQVQNSVIKSIEKQSLVNLIFTLFLSGILAIIVASNIVRQFKKLLLVRELAVKRQQELQQLEKWQNTARSLVHEIRAPLTPIKLICSAWQNTLEESLPQKEFLSSQSIILTDNAIPTELLNEGLLVINSKLQLIESMINRFTLFAKLPAPVFQKTHLSKIVENFVNQYQCSFKNTEISVKNDFNKEPESEFDEGLLHNSFFAILKNASEANLNRTIKVEFNLSHSNNKCLRLLILNNGCGIPETLIENLFDFGSSSKLPGTHNFGIGLAMTKKIVLEHKAEVSLYSNKSNESVGFLMQFYTE